MEIVPGVFLVNGDPFCHRQNSYVVKIDDMAVMIDSGDLDTPSFETVRRNCLDIGVDLSRLSFLLVTHSHFDHASHAARLQKLGVDIISSQDAAEAMESGDDRCIGYAGGGEFERCNADRIVNDGEDLALGDLRFHCIAAPGHAESCMIYETILNNMRIWFVGDVVITGPACQSVELGWTGAPDYDRHTYLETLKRLCHMECDCVFPGHGPQCIGGGKRILEMAYTKALIELR